MTAELIEREYKFRVESLGAVAEKLAEVGAERAERSVLERNWLLDSNNRFRDSGRVLRLRLDGSGALMTYKGPVRHEQGARVRTEVEVGVTDVERARSLLKSLGYDEAGYYEKRRATWVLGSTKISLDETPIGSFVEIEGERAGEVVSLLGFDAEEAESRSYIALYEAHRAEHPEAPVDMVFET